MPFQGKGLLGVKVVQGQGRSGSRSFRVKVDCKNNYFNLGLTFQGESLLEPRTFLCFLFIFISKLYLKSLWLVTSLSEFDGIDYLFSQNGLVTFKNGQLIARQVRMISSKNI